MPPDLTTRFCLRFNLRLRRLALACVAAAGLVPALVAAPAVAEEPTPQAVNAHAEFLADPATPPPPAPVKVCVVDTGVDLTTDAAPAVVERYSEFGGTVDDTGGGGIAKHGTYVAGVIASQMDGVGSVGIWPRARIVSVRVFPDKDSGTTVATYLQALDLCRDREAKVVNLSLSGLATATPAELARLESRITDLHSNNDMSVVAATGNTGSEIGYPAKFPSVVAVGASDAADTLCDFTARGPELDLAALGCGVVLSLSGGQLAVASGTSYAAPLVSGALAALRAYRPEMSASEAETVLSRSARPGRGSRVLDVGAAFRAAGLADLAAAPASVKPDVSPSSSAPLPVAARADMAQTVDPLAQLGIRKPRVRSARYSRRVLRVVVAGVPDFGRAVFQVDGHLYRRTTGKLKVRLMRAPKRVTVRTEIPSVGDTAAVRIAVMATPAPSRARRG